MKHKNLLTSIGAMGLFFVGSILIPWYVGVPFIVWGAVLVVRIALLADKRIHK